jgi:polar amino acid transport system substrate-binding protein
MLFSDPYINNRQVVLTRFNDTIDTLAELTSVKIGVQSTSASEMIVEENVTFTGQGELLKYDTFNEALIDLNNGLISAVVMDEITGRYAISQQPNQFRVMSEDFGGKQYGIGFRLANDTIRDTVNDTLFDLIDSGEATSISETWFSEDVLIRR